VTILEDWIISRKPKGIDLLSRILRDYMSSVDRFKHSQFFSDNYFDWNYIQKGEYEI
jgi:hypothetical protein